MILCYLNNEEKLDLEIIKDKLYIKRNDEFSSHLQCYACEYEDEIVSRIAKTYDNKAANNCDYENLKKGLNLIYQNADIPEWKQLSYIQTLENFDYFVSLGKQNTNTDQKCFVSDNFNNVEQKINI
jgi:hypothetical protein